MNSGTSSLRAPEPIRVRLRTSGVGPFLAILGCTAANLAVLAWARLAGLPQPREARLRRRARARRAAAERWARLLGSLRGAYAKAGQFAASRPDLLPEEAVSALATLRDRVSPVPIGEIRDVVEFELGGPLEDFFQAFEALPLGAASIAQAHRASLRDGTPVVVKVQYPWIGASLAGDLRLLRGMARVLVRLGSRRGWRADFQRFFDEFAEGLASELDFEAEARAAAEIARNLADDTGVLVPQVLPDYSTRRVLTVGYQPCISIGDRPGLVALGVVPAKVLEIIVRAYAKQIFEDGLFHADPHPGNLFVVDEAGAAQNPRVLFVDFGLHRRLTPELQKEIRLGIFALLQRDVNLFVERMQALDMIASGAEEGVRRAVSEMLERIAAVGGTGAMMSAPGSQVLDLKDEAKRLLQETPGLQLPGDLLLYAKTLSYLFALGDELDPEVDLMKLAVPYLMKFLAARD